MSEFIRIAPHIFKLGDLATKTDSSASAAHVQGMIVTELRDTGHPIQIELKLDSQQVEWTASIPNPVISVDSATQTTSGVRLDIEDFILFFLDYPFTVHFPGTLN